MEKSMSKNQIEIVDLSSDTESEDDIDSSDGDDDVDSDISNACLDNDGGLGSPAGNNSFCSDADEEESPLFGIVKMSFPSKLKKREINPKEDPFYSAKKRFNVKECSVRLERITGLSTMKTNIKRKRKKSNYRGDNIHACSKCSIKFASAERRDTHYKRQHEGIDKPYECSTCKETFALPGMLKDHENEHTGEVPYECEECGEKFATRKLRKSHRFKAHNPDERCEHCGKHVKGKASYLRHLKLHIKELAIPCDLCDKTFTNTRDMRRHKGLKHPGSDPSLPIESTKCQYCEKTFSSRAYLLVHERSHTGDLNLACEICGYRTCIPSVLKAHRLIHSDAKDFMCEQCPYSCKTLARLNDHKLNVHAEGRKYLCTFCGMSFKNKNNWLGHEVLHRSDDNAFNCSICGRGFKVRRYLVSHFRHAHQIYGKIPQGESLTNISESQFDTEENNEKKKQKKESSQVRKYECMYCLKGFKYKNNLVSHELLHTNEVGSLTCPICTRGFKVRGHLIYHLRRAHDITGKIPLDPVELAQMGRAFDDSNRNSQETTPGLAEIPVTCLLSAELQSDNQDSK